MLSSDSAHLHLFCPEETSARLFWNRLFLYPLSKQHGHKLDIVLIGCGRLGKELLLKGLQINLFDPAQQIHYHVFGDEDGFSAVYHELSQIGDTVQFYDSPWHCHLPLLERAHAVIVAEQEKQVALLRDMTLALGQKPIHVFAADMTAASMVAQGTQLHLFDWRAEGTNLNAMCDYSQEYAMRINLRYASLYEGIPETEQNKWTAWAKLNTFTRYSNLSAADYHTMRCKMMQYDGVSYPISDASYAEKLSELEHMRWCRYHYLNNWKRGEQGTRKNPMRRLHAALVPYDELSEAEKEKDRENLRVMFSLDTDSQ